MPHAEPNPLHDRIIRLIKAGGALSLAEYMHLCMADPEHGYYRQREVIGGSGDFITAPEISQMFGELVGIWCIAAWQALDRPTPFTLAEMGPGNGTLIGDVLRAGKQMPGFLEAADLRLVETSAQLRQKQQHALAPHAGKTRSIEHLDDISKLPDKPLIAFANEFLDVVPFHQYVKTASGWHEVGVSVDANGALQRGATQTRLETLSLPAGAENESEGAIFEFSPTREAIIEDLSVRIAKSGGAVLIIDYGHLHSGFGDTFQAVADHQHVDPLSQPGKVDLTSHVDFERLSKVADSVPGIDTALTTQGEFLLEMGLLERAGALGSGKPPQEQEAIREQVERLAAPERMGNLFKVMGIFPRTLRLPGFLSGRKTG